MSIKETIKIFFGDLFSSIKTSIQKDINEYGLKNKPNNYFLKFLKSISVDIIETLFKDAKDFVQSKIDELTKKLSVVLANAIASVLSFLVAFVFVVISLIFASISLSLWIGDVINNNALGFLIVSVLWLVLLLIFIKFIFTRKRFEKLINKKIH